MTARAIERKVKKEKTVNSLLETLKVRNMNFELIKSDIHRIGGAAYHNDEGNCVIVFYEDDVAYQIEYIFLRNILKLFGDQYRITSEDEYVDEKEGLSIHLTTNLPWDIYMAEDEAMTD